ncbi:hypothetical protein Slin15195_G110210 [Septoria linicola]|uniref:Uncharacterized protein n=1 Tax=Septoria linicola TaxID=215465 RepID=A0A9Q9B5F3_9PEZI|nr:hypothetical protein Slin15195_G110210 [Septoria linicola]
MATCCARASNATSNPVHLWPDCYSWCNVDLVEIPGSDAVPRVLFEFYQCLQEENPRRYPMMYSDPSKNGPVTKEPTSTMTLRPTDGEPVAPTQTSSGKHGASEGLGVAGLIAMAVVVVIAGASS